MAELIVDRNDVVVHLSTLESLGTWRREVRVPIDCLRMVHVEERPLDCVALVRVPGLAWPGSFALGSRRHGGQREFVVVRAKQPAVVLDAQGALWDRVVVSHPDAVDIAAELAALLLGRGPGHNGHNGQAGSPRRQRSRRAADRLKLERGRAGASA
jgi:hypothetical protein